MFFLILIAKSSSRLRLSIKTNQKQKKTQNKTKNPKLILHPGIIEGDIRSLEYGYDDFQKWGVLHFVRSRARSTIRHPKGDILGVDASRFAGTLA